MLVMFMEKHGRKSRQTKFLKRVRAICNLHSCYNVALVLHEKCTRFQPIIRANNVYYILRNRLDGYPPFSLVH